MIVSVFRIAPDDNPAVVSLEALRLEDFVQLMMPKTAIKIRPASARALADWLYHLAAEIEADPKQEKTDGRR